MKTTLGRLFMPMLQPGLDCVLTSEELVPYETDQTVKEQDVQKRKEFSSESEDNLGCKRTKPLNENLLQDHGELALPPSCTPFTNTDDGALMSIPAVIEALRKDIFVCASTCMCKLSLMAQASGSHVDKPRAVAEEILTHKWHGVPEAPRRDYCGYLETFLASGMAPRTRRKRTGDDEVNVRNTLHDQLCPTDQQRIQTDVNNCDDTVERNTKSENMRNGVLAEPDSDSESMTVDRPPAVLETEAEKFYEVERVIGSSVSEGQSWYLIKWVGYPVEECSWEPSGAVEMSRDAVKLFHKTYGKPSAAVPQVLSPEGHEFTDYVGKINTGKVAVMEAES